MAPIRVMHYMNQFFAGLGGEDKANMPAGFIDGPVGPGKRLQSLCRGAADIVVTAYCGDDYFSQNRDEAVASILKKAREKEVKLLVAGPAFASGRYGVAATEVCQALGTSLGIDCITAMHPDNPGVEAYRQYKNKRVFTFPTGEVVSGMESALLKMAQFVSKLAAGSPAGPPSEEGYLPRGIRPLVTVSKTGVERAIGMLLDKMAGRPFVTEIPVEGLEPVPVAPPIRDLKNACIGLMTTMGVLPPGNPDGFKVFKNTQWKKYSLKNLNSMLDGRWDVIHGGYNTEFMKKNPNFGVPLDACRDLEKEGVFARLYPEFYMATGVNALIPVMQRIGKEMVRDMKEQGVGGALLVSA